MPTIIRETFLDTHFAADCRWKSLRPEFHMSLTTRPPLPAAAGGAFGLDKFAVCDTGPTW